jgi:predicted RNA-binding protein with EMAP domain
VTTKKYIANTKENSSRIQNLRVFLGVDDFVSVENLKNLLEKSLTVKSYKNLEQNLDVKYTNNILNIYTNFIFENKNPFSGYILLYFNGQKSIDIPALFSNFYTITKREIGDIVNVDLEKLFYYLQQFAKVGNNTNNNYA